VSTVFGFREAPPRFVYGLMVGLSIVGSLVIWWGVSASGILPEAYFPDPIRVAMVGTEMFLDQGFVIDVLASSARIAGAFTISAAIGIPLGLLMSSFKIAEGLFEPVVDFIRYVPVPSLLPIFVLLSGIGEESKFLVLFFGTFFQLALLIKDDADQMPMAYFDVGRTMGASTLALIRDLLVPYLLPQIYDRLRVTLGWCWTYLVIAELIAVDRGMGRIIKEAQRFQDADRLFVCFIVLGLIGLITDFAAKFLFRVLFPYVPRTPLSHG
jgi:NitT/TauT family transport system permease protein